ncbi:MAG: MATE family efflux transporter [Lachnospiraceae bacterium]|nr:MATE family efflux transporter [Lachnospiraceae bacterium]
MQKDLTKGSVLRNLIYFSLPYLLSCFLQTFYGLTDLFITGQFNGADTISAVSIGSQVTHMLTVIIVGLAMGTTVIISRAIGSKKPDLAARGIGNTILLFALFSIFTTILLLLSADLIIAAISTPVEAVSETKKYLMICFIGVPFITAYNVISSIFRGLGDSKSPMYFVAVAGVINIILDILFIGPLGMGAAGAALATIIAQAASVAFALFSLRRAKLGTPLSRQDLRFDRNVLSSILKVGLPIAFQDGFIQISFLVITAIANQRGVIAAASVGIVEKIICFLFLVPSAMLSSISAIAAQNAGAGQHKQGAKVLRYGITICVSFGLLAAVICEIWTEPILQLFVHDDAAVVRMGCQYLRAYVFDCVFAGIHFSFSGYFCAYRKAFASFIQNLLSILLVRIPGAYLTSMLFPDTLFPMGLAAPAGSLFSALVCVLIYSYLRKKHLLYE